MPDLPKVLVFDIETMANLAYVWGKYEQNVISFEKEWYMLTFAYKWLGEKKSYVKALPDYKGYKNDKTNDKRLCKELWELFDEADVLISHNGDAFDIKKAQARFAFHGFSPPKPFKSIDTLKVARRYFKFTSNKLDDLGHTLGLGGKIETGGWELWKGCAVDDDPKAWKKMKLYNKRDITLLEDVYMELRPWMNNHPNYNIYMDTQYNCPVCHSDNLHKRGFAPTRASKQQRYVCLDCGTWSQAPVSGRGVVR
jgi:DNA polymerase elongation subunit (family B)